MFYLQTFEEAALCETLSKNVSKSGYVKPTPVQKHGIPIISAGRDIMACAQTGSGKTVKISLKNKRQSCKLAFGLCVNVFPSIRLHSCYLFCSSWWLTAWPPVASVNSRSRKPLSWPQRGSSSTRFTWRPGSFPLGTLRFGIWQSNADIGIRVAKNNLLWHDMSVRDVQSRHLSLITNHLLLS